MKRVARILYDRYLDASGNRYIGGVESYIKALSEILRECGYVVYIYQYSDEMFIRERECCVIFGISGKHNSNTLLNYIECNDKPNYKEDLLIFATDLGIVKNKYKHCLSIQHGIAWDINTDNTVSDLKNVLTVFKGALRTLRKYQRYKWCNNIVCVDYNFLNWYRTQIAHVDATLYIIPNFASTSVTNHRRSGNSPLSIVFARRLVDYRGTKLYAEAINDVSAKYPEVLFTIAGDGPDEKWLRQHVGKLNNVVFTKYRAEDSVEFHSKFDIAVVPTKGSEGTSLSLLEAMAAGCAVIATNVGGLTNVILDEYNGLMTSPDVTDIRDAIIRLIEDKELRNYLSEKARETVSRAFSYEKWKRSWVKVIRQIEKE